MNCYNCGSENVYVSPNGYDTVIVCKDCYAEKHHPQKETKEATTDISVFEKFVKQGVGS